MVSYLVYFTLELKYLSLSFELSGAANIHEGLEPRTPALQFQLPLEDVTAPHNNKVRAPVACGGRGTQHSPLSRTVLVKSRHWHVLCSGRVRVGLKQLSSGVQGHLPTTAPGLDGAPLSLLPAATGGRPDSQEALSKEWLDE